MRSVFSPGIVICLCVIFALPLPAAATPAITCHCFTDRSFDPGSPAKADPYFLATTQNSFFALLFTADKKDIVMKKQQGISSDDLWIAYAVASESCSSPELLLKVKKNSETWTDVLTPSDALGTRFSAALKARSSSAQLAAAVVDEMFRRHKVLAGPELTALRQAGATSQELVLAAVLSARTRQPARQIYQKVKKGSATWGTLLQTAKIDTRNMQQEISGILKLNPKPVARRACGEE